MTIKTFIRTSMQTGALVSAALCMAPIATSATTLTSSNFTGTHFHTGGNVGEEYRTTSVADRTESIPITPGGLAFLSTVDIYAGEIPSVASTRLGRGEAFGTTVGLVEDDGFFFTGSVESVATCTLKSNLTGCVPFMTSQARASFEFTSDMDSTLFLDGIWQGGNGTESLVSSVDFFSLSIRELPDVGGPLNIFNVDTNIFNRSEAGGLIDDQVALKAGATYEFAFFHSASSQSPDVSGASDSDSGSFAFSASFVQSNDAAFYEARVASLMAPVPLPAGSLLLLSGLGGIVAFRRAKKRAA